MMSEDLLNTLEDLGDEEFNKFKWFLQQTDVIQGPMTIKKSRLETTSRWDTVDLMVQTYRLSGAVEVTRRVLKRIGRNDLLLSLSVIRPRPEVNVSDLTSQAPLPQTEDVMVPVPEPQPITHYQQMLRSNFQDKFMCAQEGWAEDKQRLADIYTELYITAGYDIHINIQHEVRQIEKAWKPEETEKAVKPTDIFKHPSGEYRPIKTVMTNGIAGIGKTFLVHKFVLDWAEQRYNQDVHLVFPFTFRQLNPLKGKKFSLAELIHECIPETVGITEEALNYIFKDIQSSGITNYDKSKFKLLFVLDGLDESRLHLDFHSEDIRSVDVTKSTKTDVLLKKLINGKLLRSARIWITTRPAAANQIPREFISIFCWINATVLEDVLKTRGGQLPKTLTEMYAEFLVFQIDRTKEKYGPQKSIEYIKSLAKLAFQQLDKGNLIFYEKDLRESSTDVSEASVCSGVFTEIFKEERGRKGKDGMFSFVHLSVQEFLAALYVRMSLSNSNINVMPLPQPSLKNLRLLLRKTSSKKIHMISIDRALQSPNGHLDLFLRFLLGLSLQTNQDKLQDLLMKKDSGTKTNQKTVQYIRKKLSENLSPDRCINLFHCLNELNDCSLKYSASEEALLRLLPVVKASHRALLSGCNLSERSCGAMLSVISSRSTNLRELDLSNNDLWDSGVKLLSVGLESLHCTLEALRLSGCLITQDGCTSLVLALNSNPSHLRELDLSYNHPGDSGMKLLSSLLDDPRWRLNTLRLDHGGEQRLKPGLRKYSCDLKLDTNSVHRKLKLSDNNRRVTAVTEEQPYPDHPERFEYWLQLLCTNGLTGRCYWEVEWSGEVHVSVTYRGVAGRGGSNDGRFGANSQSWSLRCSDADRYSVCHNNRRTDLSSSSSSVSNRAAVYMDCPAGTLSFYRVSSDTLIHLHTFNTTFTEPLYPGFWLLSYGSSVSLCSL
uniref:NACHT, LRR and PYD domains-containing protein 3 n=1 Tax=Maylandia zebra TaxID=106582 RepID=UPI000D30D212|nr:NACHT, LRR and PYD domains-containing protein 3 [Maylandia zebra]